MNAWKRLLRFLCSLSIFAAVLASGCIARCDAGSKPGISVSYFYINACGSCDKEGELRLAFYSLIGPLKDDADIDLKMYNTFHGDEALLLEKYYDAYKVPTDRRQLPILFIGGTCLSGTDEINARLKTEFLQVVRSPSQAESPFIAPPGDATDTGPGYIIKQNKTNDTVVIYFYVPSCVDCEKAAQFLKTIKKQDTASIDGNQIVTGVTVKKYNAGEATNMKLLKQYFKYYKVPEKEQKAPIVFLGGEWFSGADTIRAGLQDAISSGRGIGTIEMEDKDANRNSRDGSLPGYSILGVLGAGLVNGLNPCSLSMVLFLLSLLVVKNVSLLKAGLAFVFGKFILFFLLGTLLYGLFLKANIQWFQTLSKGIVVALAAVFFVLNIHDMISAKKENYGKVRLQLPKGLRGLNHRIIKAFSAVDNERVFLPLSFLIGMVIAAGEFLCTGQIYLATIVLVLQSKSVFDSQAILYFTLYCTAFVAPLIVIIALVHKGKEVFEVSEAVRARIPLIKAINSLVFLIFAVLIILL